MQNSAEADKIISQANAWTFEGDCSLLQWMQQISENLEQHVNKTSKSLDKLSANTKRTGIALDNAANSLTALQYTQFVESRCQDDDETITSATEGTIDSTANGNATAPSSTEVLKMFMLNNMQMLQNCHEKYALDFDDSDDDDATTAAANNCIYQAKNPYNERPLPHIYGSKLWKENWHVGLCDGANDYSGDEISEAFSESSGSAEENESYGSNSAHTSDWASSSSVLHDKFAQNARNLPPSISTMPAAVPKPIPAIINVSTPTKPLPTSAVRLPEHDDLFATLQHTPPTTTSSSSAGVSNTSSRETSQASSYSSSDKRNTYQQRQAEAATPAPNTAPVTEEVEERKPATINIKRKPVNLFDDADFDSLMSEIVDKAHGNKTDTPIAAPRKLSKTSTQSTSSTNTPTSQTAATPARNNSKLPNLFDSPRSSPERENTFSPITNTIEVPKSVAKQPLNLFDSPEASPPNVSLLPAAAKTTVNAIKKITPKSLFDDDDDDDDFLNVFGAKKVKAFIKPQTIGRKSLFDDDDDDVDISIAKNVKQDAVQVKQTKTVVVETIENAEKIATKENTDFSSEKHSASVASASNADVAIKTTQQDKEKTLKNTTKKVNLFDDDEEDTESGNLFSIQKSAAIIAKSSVEQSEIGKTASIPKKVNLFDDVEDDTKDAKSANIILKKNNSLPTETKVNVINEVKNVEEPGQMAKSTLLSKKVDLFGDVEDENKDDDMFSSLETKSTQNLASENVEEKVVSKVEEAASIPMPQQTTTENVDKEVDDKDFANTTHISKVNEQTNPTATITASITEDEESRKNVREDSDIPKIEAEIETVSNKSEVDEDPANQTVTKESSAPTNSEVECNTLPTNELETVLPDTLPSITPTPKPSTTTNYANIFLDEPPDDDDFFQTLIGNSSSIAKSDNDFPVAQDFYEPPLPDSPPSSVMSPPPTTAATKEAKTDTVNVTNQKDITSNSASDYSGLRLFSDIPPDDYDVDNFAVGNAVEQSKTLHSVFYDDFNETATATQTQAATNKLKMPQHALFDDEPPTDDDDFGSLMGTGVTEKGAGDAFTKEIKTERKMPEKEADETDRVNQVSNEIAKTTIENAVEEEKANVPHIKPISKLPKLNINVQALLPNPTGRLNFKKASEANATPNTGGEDSSPLLISPQTTTPTPTNVAAVVADAGNVADGNDRILTSLCKNRVRAPAQRRPSTRRGRQENYRKSLLMAEDDTDDVTTQTQQQTSSITTNLPTSNIVEKIPSEIEPELEHKHDTNTVDIPQKETEKKLGLSLPTFLDVNDDDDDDFMFNASAANINKTPENLFSTATTTARVEAEQLTKTVDKVFPILSPLVKPKKSMKDLFDDSDASDGADDLFASKNSIESENLSSKTLVAISQTTASTANPFDTESLQPKVTPKTLPTTAPIKPKAKSLFSDTDSDSDDDLFKTTSNKSNDFIKNDNNSGHSKPTESTVDQLPQPKHMTVKSSTAKLFDSDSDDNDSNFLGSLKAKQQQPQGKAQTVKTSAPKESKGLFSDAESDDDDDLFGSKTKKAAVNKSIPSKQGTSTTKAITTSTAIKTDNITGIANAKLQDNPLADLLN